MAKKFSKEFIDNQNILKEAKACGGSDGFKNKYRQEGRQLERDKNAKILNFVIGLCGPYVVEYITKKISTSIENKRKEKQNKEQT